MDTTGPPISIPQLIKFSYSSNRKGKNVQRDEKLLESFELYNINLAHIHALSHLAADRTDSRERSLKRRRMNLSIPSTLKTTTAVSR